MALLVRVDLPDAQRVSTSFLIELDTKTRDWRLVKPIPGSWSYFVTSGLGSWSVGVAQELYLYESDSPTEKFLLRGWEKAEGPISTASGYAFARRSQDKYLSSGSWQRVARPLPKGQSYVWAGLAIKGGGEIAAGFDVAVCHVLSISNLSKSMTFAAIGGRLGVAIGASGGVCFVLVTGFSCGNDLDNYTTWGWDWALSLGGQWGPAVTRIVQGTRFKEALDIARIAKYCAANADDIVTTAKGVYGVAAMDWQQQNVNVISSPVGVGLEAGVFVVATTLRRIAG